MATKPIASVKEANLTYSEMEAAISKIDRRLGDLNSFDPKLSFDDSALIFVLQNKLKTLIQDIFGANTAEFNRYKNVSSKIDTHKYFYGAGGTRDANVRLAETKENKRRCILQLESIKADFIEKLEDAGRDRASKTVKAYQGLDLHPKISLVADALFQDGHYSNAIMDSVKALNSLVQLNSGVDDKDGVALMQFVFSQKSPVLQFNDLVTDSDKDEQKGFMMMFSGAVSGLRNPRAHSFVKDDPERSLEFIAFVSLLAKLCDEAKRAP